MRIFFDVPILFVFKGDTQQTQKMSTESRQFENHLLQNVDRKKLAFDIIIFSSAA